MNAFLAVLTILVLSVCYYSLFSLVVGISLRSDARRERELKKGAEQIKLEEMMENTEAIVAANRHFLETGEDLTEDYNAGEHVGTMEHFERILGRR